MTDSVEGLDPEEMSVWTDNHFMPVKQRVWEKLEARLDLLNDQLRTLEFLSGFPEAWLTTPGRIYRGEHYQSYSYRSLDVMRHSRGENLALLRVVLLWGHPVGIHLILVGEPRAWWLEQKNMSVLPVNEWWLSCHDNPWVWEFPDEGWEKLSELTPGRCAHEIHRRQFLKISSFLPVDQIDRLEEFVQAKVQELDAGGAT